MKRWRQLRRHVLRTRRSSQGLGRPSVQVSNLPRDDHLATALGMSAAKDMEKAQRAHIVALVIHGGAGGTTTPDMPADLLEAYRNRLRSVLTTTYAAEHASSLDAVCHAVEQLEDSPLFNAGKGAVFDLAGNTVCECSLMTTQPHLNSNTVAVTGVERTKNPIALARVLMEKNKELGGHAFYSGEAAEQAGWKYGTKQVGKRYYWTKRRWNEHKRGLDKIPQGGSKHECCLDGEEDEDLPAYSQDAADKMEEHEDQAVFDRYANMSDFLPQGTVGAVALDSNGHLSVATSTGGKTNKFPGRIGDTPSVGSGFLADSWTSTALHRHQRSWLVRVVQRVLLRAPPAGKAGKEQGVAISGTGDGDFFLRTCFASSIADRIRFANVSVEQAIKAAMAEIVGLYGKPKGVGGAIVLDGDGNAYFPVAAATMNRGLISKHTGFRPRIAIFDHEKLA
ncbi:hypothetical protein L1887_48201 [Cichorium endivia]|nr:hypothetical protein L1887_48201 [Cichorium endivia]